MKTYISWAFGNICIREAGTDRVLWSGRKTYPITQMDTAFEYAESIVKRNHWILV